jgi:FtsH-binding integral membrane protein
MSPETLKEAKNFRMQMKWCSIICWIATLVFIFMQKNPNAGMDWVIVPVGAGIFTVIYFNMRSMINKYESLTKKN